MTTSAISGSTGAAWLSPGGNVQSGLVYLLGLVGWDGVGGDEVGADGRNIEHPLAPKIRLVNTNAISVYLILFSIFTPLVNYNMGIVTTKISVLSFTARVTQSDVDDTIF